MKPDAWRDRTYGNLHDVDWGNSTPLYSAATIRKWLEEVSDEVINSSVTPDTSLVQIRNRVRIYRAMLAAKLQELENDK